MWKTLEQTELKDKWSREGIGWSCCRKSSFYWSQDRLETTNRIPSASCGGFRRAKRPSCWLERMGLLLPDQCILTLPLSGIQILVVAQAQLPILWDGQVSNGGFNSTGVLCWDWGFLIVIPGNLDGNANQELSFSSALYNWLTVLGNACPVPFSIQYLYHRGSLITRCSHIYIYIYFVFLLLPPNITLAKHWQLWWVSPLLLRAFISPQIFQLNSPVWLLKWKLNILPTRKTNLKIHF